MVHAGQQVVSGFETKYRGNSFWRSLLCISRRRHIQKPFIFQLVIFIRFGRQCLQPVTFLHSRLERVNHQQLLSDPFVERHRRSRPSSPFSHIQWDSKYSAVFFDRSADRQVDTCAYICYFSRFQATSLFSGSLYVSGVKKMEWDAEVSSVNKLVALT